MAAGPPTSPPRARFLLQVQRTPVSHTHFCDKVPQNEQSSSQGRQGLWRVSPVPDGHPLSSLTRATTANEPARPGPSEGTIPASSVCGVRTRAARGGFAGMRLLPHAQPPTHGRGTSFSITRVSVNTFTRPTVRSGLYVTHLEFYSVLNCFKFKFSSPSQGSLHAPPLPACGSRRNENTLYKYKLLLLSWSASPLGPFV